MLAQSSVDAPLPILFYNGMKSLVVKICLGSKIKPFMVFGFRSDVTTNSSYYGDSLF